MPAFKLKDLDTELKFFGITLLIFESLMITFFLALEKSDRGKNWMEFVYGNLIFIALIVVFFLIYIRMTKSKMAKTPSDREKPNSPTEVSSFNNEYYSTLLKGLINDFAEIDQIEESLFHKYVKIECADFAIQTEKWKNSKVSIPKENYDSFLIDAYKNAKDTVFSTSIKDYFSIWSEPFGERIIESHKQSRATTNRVFVFETRSDITTEFVEIMKVQEDAGVLVRIFIDDEFPEFNFPADLSKDFTVIDNGKIIGKTVTFGRSRNAEWVFDNSKESDRFQGYVERLKKGSLKLSEL